MDFANVNSPIPGFSTKIDPKLTRFHITQYFRFPKIRFIQGPHCTISAADKLQITNDPPDIIEPNNSFVANYMTHTFEMQ